MITVCFVYLGDFEAEICRRDLHSYVENPFQGSWEGGLVQHRHNGIQPWWDTILI